jgi:prevent-host-death family protein
MRVFILFQLTIGTHAITLALYEAINHFVARDNVKCMKNNGDTIGTVVTALTARTQLGQILRRVKGRRERFLIGRRGQPQAVLLGIDDFMQTFAAAPDWLERSWKAAERNGTASMSMRQIDAEIARVHAGRRPSREPSPPAAK